MQLKPIAVLAVLLLVVVSLSVAGCTTSSTSSQNPTASATPQVSGVSPTPIATIATPSVSSNENISSRLDAYRSLLIEQGYSFPTSFNKTTLNGKEAYLGNYQKNGRQYEENIYPMKSYADAVNFKETLINAYKNQGYETYTSSTANETNWYGTSGNTMVMIQALDETNTLEVPVTWVTITPIES